MPISNKDVDDLASRLQVGVDRKHDKPIAILERHMRKTLPKHYDSKIRVTKVIRGGSLYKGTAVVTKFDVDLVFLVSLDVEEFLKSGTQKRLKKALFASLEEHPDIEVDESTMTNVFPAAGCKLYGLDFDVLIGMSFIGGQGVKAWSEAQLEAAQQCILSCSSYHTGIRTARALSGSLSQTSVVTISEETDTLKRAAVLLKYWAKDFHKLDRFKSFFAESIALAAVEELRQEGATRLTIRKIFARCLRILDLSAQSGSNPRVVSLEHLGLYDEGAWEGWLPDPKQVPHQHRMAIVNFMTPNLDALFSVHSHFLRQWSDTAKDSLSILEDPSSSMHDLFGVTPGEVEFHPQTGGRVGAVAACAVVALPARRY